MDIIYFGSEFGTSLHRARALRRLGHQVAHIDPRELLPESRWIDRWIFHTGALFLERIVKAQVLSHSLIEDGSFNLVWVNDTKLLGPGLVRALKRRFGRIVCYVNDDPFGDREARARRLFLKAVPEYDLIAVVREENVREAYEHGAKDVMRVFMSADEVVHAPQKLGEQERKNWQSEVLFAGTGMEQRGPFLATLVELGVPLTLYGDRWQKQPGWDVLKKHWKGPALEGDDYTKALQEAKVCIGLLSEGNRDLHTRRSMEIPYAGSVLCAERTREHQELYEEGEEAIFWENVEECAEVCFSLLRNEERRRCIAENGRQRCIENGHLNERVMEKIVSRVSNK